MPTLHQGTFISIGQHNSRHKSLLAVVAERVPDEFLIGGQLFLQHQWVPPVKPRTGGWVGHGARVSQTPALSSRFLIYF